MSSEEIRYTRDRDVDDELNRALIELLSRCFTGPEDEVFRHRRYWKQPPQHRWYIPHPQGGSLTAHIAVHEKTLATETGELFCAGIAEVAVDPEYRGHGYAKRLLEHVHGWLADQQFDAAVLFGDPRIYRSSGYRVAENPVRYYDDHAGTWKEQRFADPAGGCFMYRMLRDVQWPDGTIDLRGPKF
jgi:GNAT superfamily N-acetyltransferase